VTDASFTINGGNTVYSAAPTVTISGGNNDAEAIATLDANNIVNGIQITKAGTGFTTAPDITFSGGTITSGDTGPTGTGNADNLPLRAVTPVPRAQAMRTILPSAG
jgi:hypothetical protein